VKRKYGLFLCAMVIFSLCMLSSCDKVGEVLGKKSEERVYDGVIRALFVSPYDDVSLKNCFWLKNLAMEQKIYIDWEVISADEWEKCKKQRLESEEIPDIFINALETGDFVLYEGKFENLEKHIGYDTPNISKMFRETKDLINISSMYSGELFALPSYSAAASQISSSNGSKSVLFINQSWLKRLKLNTPATFDELEAVLRRFRVSDCNLDGDVSDEIPFDFHGFFGDPQSAFMLLGAFGVQFTDSGKDGYFMENRQVKSAYIDPRYKYLLAKLARWYKEGLIRDAALISSYSSFLDRSHGRKNGSALVGLVLGKEESAQFGNNLASSYRVIPPPVVTFEGEEREVKWSQDVFALRENVVSISSECPKKDAVMRFIDSIYSADMSIYSLFGDSEFVEKRGNLDYKVFENENHLDSFGFTGPHFLESGILLSLPDSYTYALLERTQYKKFAVNQGDFCPEIFLKYPHSLLKSLSEAQVKINKVAKDFALEVIRGERNIEEDWQSYEAELKSLGLEKTLAARQAAFNRTFKK